jgi:tagatose-6-phosphate ketose/aldose isomerase
MSATSRLLELSTAERESRGLVHTLGEILQQPQTWLRTYEKVLKLSQPIQEFLSGAGVGTKSLKVLLIGAGTSDYIGKSVCALLQKEWLF